MLSFSRRQVMAGAPGLSVFGLAAPALAVSTPEWLPQQDPVLVKEMVGVSHRDIKRVRELVERQPALVNATVDWGFGDWEDAIGAAAHTGRREIAEFLLANGARITIFAAAMLGHLDVVKALVAAQPGIHRKYGPHGIPLLAHAQAGGPGAQEVVKYLETLGDAGVRTATQPLESADRDAILGRYVFGPGSRNYFEVDVVSDRLGWQRPGASRGLLHHTGALVFFPVGAPAVKVAFARENGKVTQLTIADPDVFVTAKRV